jgi:hypothetical protein
MKRGSYLFVLLWCFVVALSADVEAAPKPRGPRKADTQARTRNVPKKVRPREALEGSGHKDEKSEQPAPTETPLQQPMFHTAMGHFIGSMFGPMYPNPRY